VRSRVALALLFSLPLLLTVALGSVGMTLHSKRAELWPHRFSGNTPSLPFKSPDTMMELALSPDGQSLLIGDTGGMIQGWDVRSQKKILTTFLPDDYYTTYLAFSPDGKSFAVTSDGPGHTLAVKEVATGKSQRTWHSPPKTFYALAFSPDNTHIATGADVATLWNIHNASYVRRFPGHNNAEISAVAFSPDGKILAVSDSHGFIRLWSLADGKRLRQWKVDRFLACSLAFSPTQTTLAAVGSVMGSSPQQASIRLWDVQMGKQTGKVTAADISDIAYLPDGRLAYCPKDRRIALLLPDGKSQTIGETKADIFSLSLSRDGTKVAVACDDGIALVWPVPKTP
jgi:WD40 repeat protein